jgi:hypothetical protein
VAGCCEEGNQISGSVIMRNINTLCEGKIGFLNLIVDCTYASKVIFNVLFNFYKFFSRLYLCKQGNLQYFISFL